MTRRPLPVAFAVTAFALLFSSCKSDSGDQNLVQDTASVAAADSIPVVVPGIPDTIRIARNIRLCTVTGSTVSGRLAEVFAGGRAPAGIRRAPVDAQARAESIQRQLGGILLETRWPNGKTIRVGFINGDPTLQDRVLRAASEWSSYANINFVRAQSLSTSDVRVKFTDDQASWSQLGTDALETTRPDSQTVQFGWLTPASSDQDIQEVVLHEFGHVLGLIHEHQQPNASQIPWDRNAVYAYYWQNYRWPPRQVDAQVFALYSSAVTQFTQLDPTSIMMYAIPPELTHGQYTVAWNSTLSPTDKAFVRDIYPGR